MAFLQNELFGMNISREVMCIIGKTDLGGTNWRAVSLGSSANGSPPQQVDVRDDDDGITCFKFDGPGVPPPNSPPVGARVALRFSPLAWAFGTPIALNPTLKGPEGVLFEYLSVSSLGGATFAIVCLPDGSLFQCLPEECSILQLP